MVETIQFVGLAISSGVLILTIIVHKIEGGKKKPPEPDNPLALTTQAMEAELAELLENNRHMEHIQRLEKQIKEAKAHAEALSKVAGNYGNTTKEVGESIAGGIGGRNAIHTVKPVDSNGIVVGGLFSKGLVVEKPEEKIESTCENESETDKKTREYRNTQRRLAQKKEQDKIIRDRIQNTAIYRTYTSPTGWSTYYDYDVKLK